MRRLTAFLVFPFALLAAAQTIPPSSGAKSQSVEDFAQKLEETPKPPPEVSAGLQKRVNEFYQAEADGKWTVALQYVADDQKDAYLNKDRQRFPQWKIEKIAYADDFKKAEVVTRCQAYMTLPVPAQAEMGKPAVLTLTSFAPFTTHWKVENGEWMWYDAPIRDINTAMGSVHLSEQEAAAEKNASDQLQLPDLTSPDAVKKMGEEIVQKVQLDKTEVQFSAGKPGKESVTVTNGLDTQFELKLGFSDNVPGLTAQLDHAVVAAHGKAVLTIDYDPQGKPPITEVIAQVVVDPAGLILPVRIHLK